MFQLSKLALKILAHLFRSNDQKRDKGLCEPDGLIAHRNLVYQPKNGEAGLLDIYTPQEGTEALPTIISVHGGGFCYGDKERYRFYCMELALQGYTVVNFNYRLLPFRCPAPLCDFNDVMHFIAHHAQEYRINPHRLYAVGDSAGATVLHMYTTLLTNPDYAKMYDLTPPDLRFCAIALHSGSFALARKHNFVLREWIKGVKEGQALLNTAEYINGNYPPTFLSYSVNDPLVLETPDFSRILEQKGVPHQTVAYGQDNKKISHVFHLEIRKPWAKDCNLRQHAFFSQYR